MGPNVRRASPGYFYLVMSLIMLAVVTYGFSRTVGEALIRAHRPDKVLLAAHGAVFYSWMLLFIAQSALIRARKVRLHRLLGWFAVVDGVLVILGGAWITVHTDAPSILFRFIGMVSMLGFGIPFLLAIWWRRRPEIHRRLLLISTAVLTNAAFARFPAFFDPGHLFYVYTDLLIVAAVAHDLLEYRTVHPVYRFGLPILIAAQIAVLVPVWHLLG
jgi:hypothetical protein